AATGALALSLRTIAPSHPSHLSHPHPSHLSHPSRSSHHSDLRIAASVLAVSGFVALVYEVTWTRVLAMTLGPTTYAFSAMLVAFIAGLAIGSAIAASIVPRIHRPGVWLGGAMIGCAAAALLASARGCRCSWLRSSRSPRDGLSRGVPRPICLTEQATALVFDRGCQPSPWPSSALRWSRRNGTTRGSRAAPTGLRRHWPPVT